MSASASNPMIMSGDSFFESSDLFAAHPPTHDVGVDVDHQDVPGLSKDGCVSELSTNLPGTGASHSATSPFNIHSDVLDSVFSTSLDDVDHAQDHTPMFDELDYIIDGAKVNSKNDWVSLFGDHATEDTVSLSAVVKDEDLDEVLLAEPTAASSSTSLFSSETASSLGELDVSSMRSTPAPMDKPSKVTKSKKKKVDHLGVVSFARKQRAQELDPIKIDSSDPTALKRAKNTEAARRSRARKMERMSQLEVKVEELLNDKAQLEKEVLRLRELLSMNGIDA